MTWRHLCLVRAGLAAGLLSGLMFLWVQPATAQSGTQPKTEGEPSAALVDVPTATVDVLAAKKAGDLTVVARGHGQDKVRLSIKNTSKRRLNVVLPPGLIAASTVSQGRAGGGGVQSIGLGSVGNAEGAFGAFQGTTASGGLRSVGIADQPAPHAVTVPPGELVEFNVPGVCLNYGLPAPTARNLFRLIDVDEYTKDQRVRAALRSLATYGTSHGVAQAVMWRVCNDVTFDAMLAQRSNIMNPYEIALATRLVDALDSLGADELLDPAVLGGARIFVQVKGEGALAKDAKRLQGQLDGLSLLGLPVQVADSDDLPSAHAPALYVRVVLTSAKTGETRGRILVSACSQADSWAPLGQVPIRENSSVDVLDGAALAKVVDRAVAAAFVSVKPARRSLNSTTLRVENRLPFTIKNLVVKAGNSSGAPSVPFEGVGVGPARAALLPIQAATASMVEQVELNGL
jgi:hypothetical protein